MMASAMNNPIHIWGAYAFILSYLLAVLLGILALVRKETRWERWSAWAFIGASAILALSYMAGFPLETQALAGASEPVAKIIEKHHNMAKFVLTGCILVTSASVTVLYKYRKERFPSWFLPNLLFLSLMILSFLGLSLLQAYRIP